MARRKKEPENSTFRLAMRSGRLPERRAAQMTRAIGLRIVSGDYSPGDTIPIENELCTELGVSRTVLREAIKLLTAKGMVTPRVKIGTVVNPRSEWNFLDPALLSWLLAMGDVGPFLLKLSELRQALEPAAAALAARNATFEDFERLHRACEAMGNATSNLEAWAAADLRFHQAVYLATNNEFFWPIGRLLEPALMAGFRVIGSAHNHRKCLPEHHALRDAIISRDPQRAYQAAVDLMQTSDGDLTQMLTAANKRPQLPGKTRAATKTLAKTKTLLS